VETDPPHHTNTIGVDLKNTFKIHPKRSILIILATLQYFNKKGVETDSPTSYEHSKGGLKKLRSKFTQGVQY